MVTAPALAALRLHYVVPWVLLSWLLAYLTGRFLAGRPANPTESTVPMLLWLSIAGPAALVWFLSQWRERRLLPRSCPTPWSWSPPVAALIVLSLFSPVYVAGRSAEAALREMPAVALDDKVQSPQEGTSAVLSFLDSVERQMGASVSINGGRELCVYVFPKFREKKRDVLRGGPFSDRQVRQLVKVIEFYSDISVRTMEQSKCEDSSPIAEALSHFILSANAHHLRRVLPPSEVPGFMLVLVALGLLLGALCNGAGIVSDETLVTTCVGLWFAFAILQILSPTIVSLFEVDESLKTPTFLLQQELALRIWRWMAWLAYGVLATVTALAMAMRRSRSPHLDRAFAVLLVAPAFILGAEYGIAVRTLAVSPADFGDGPADWLDIARKRYSYHWTALFAWIPLSLAIKLLLDRYRATPSAD